MLRFRRPVPAGAGGGEWARDDPPIRKGIAVRFRQIEITAAPDSFYFKKIRELK
jgi:hypothetical protein